MTVKRASIAAFAAAILVLVAAGLIQLGASSAPPLAPSRLTPTQMRARLAGAPAPLAALHDQADEILPGGLSALRARLTSLHGTPVVVNKWSSSCEPCRGEAPIFQRVSVSRGREVAFIGIDSDESSRSEALAFLHSFPVSYPSYFDPNGQAGIAITDSAFTPITVFFNRRGHEFIQQGPFPSVAKLEAAIRRYALES
jgi:cytochrome c biogenesis protein CcmG/thiol:disulfide interchange protein DsbE